MRSPSPTLARTTHASGNPGAAISITSGAQPRSRIAAESTGAPSRGPGRGGFSVLTATSRSTSPAISSARASSHCCTSAAPVTPPLLSSTTALPVQTTSSRSRVPADREWRSGVRTWVSTVPRRERRVEGGPVLAPPVNGGLVHARHLITLVLATAALAVLTGGCGGSSSGDSGSGTTQTQAASTSAGGQAVAISGFAFHP